jgi:hypothetical protein
MSKSSEPKQPKQPTKAQLAKAEKLARTGPAPALELTMREAVLRGRDALADGRVRLLDGKALPVGKGEKADLDAKAWNTLNHMATVLL